jgi:hypothetical protein
MSHAKSQVIPPKISMFSGLKFFAGAVLGAATLGAGAVLYFFNPSTHGFYPVCEFHQLTGLNCPGCGGTRAVYQLLHGHVLRALEDNALAVLSLAGLAGRGAWFETQRFLRRPTRPFLPPEFFWPLLVMAVVFTVLRNLPAFSFLSP